VDSTSADVRSSFHVAVSVFSLKKWMFWASNILEDQFFTGVPPLTNTVTLQRRLLVNIIIIISGFGI